MDLGNDDSHSLPERRDDSAERQSLPSSPVCELELLLSILESYYSTLRLMLIMSLHSIAVREIDAYL